MVAMGDCRLLQTQRHPVQKLVSGAGDTGESGPSVLYRGINQDIHDPWPVGVNVIKKLHARTSALNQQVPNLHPST